MKVEKIVMGVLEGWKLRVWLKIALLTAVISLTALVLVFHWLTLPIAIGIVAVAFTVSFFALKSSFPGIHDVIHLLNRQLPELEHSSDLLIEEEVEGLKKIQKRIATYRLAKHYESLKLPVKFHSVLWVATISVALILFRYFADIGPEKKESLANFSFQPERNRSAMITDDSSFYRLAVSIVPPSYSGLNTVNQSVLDVENVLKGSMMYLKVTFNHQPASVWLKFSNGDSLPFEKKDQHYLVQKKIVDKGFYTLNYINKRGETVASDYARLAVIPDHPPEISIQGIPQYQTFHPSEKAEVSFDVVMSDDYGLTDAYIVATITKGSGESVKFREQKIPFRQEIKGTDVNAAVNLSARQFEMETGNELYFYVEGVDNRQPNPQKSRIETFFFVLEDTSEVLFSLEGDLGIDLMPEYFRSQRQIIIDSEKLLAERKNMTKPEFNRRSNELGFDQKALRLKYGQFIGEESASGEGIKNEVEEEHGHQEQGQVNVLSEYGHDHDHENEEGQHLDKGAIDPKEDAVSEMSHSHDDTEQATFFEQSVKTKLKAALEEMWEAELYLRLYQPENSLPYQYNALELLKEIKNHARIYVQRIGFDPPPVNEEKSRLTGDLEEVHEEEHVSQQEKEVLYPKVKEAIRILDELLGEEFPLKNTFKSYLKDAGNEVAGLAIEEPGKYLSLLSALKSFSEQDSIYDVQEVDQLRFSLMKILPPPDQNPSGIDYPEHVLVEEFIKEITKKNP